MICVATLNAVSITTADTTNPHYELTDWWLSKIIIASFLSLFSLSMFIIVLFKLYRQNIKVKNSSWLSIISSNDDLSVYTI